MDEETYYKNKAKKNESGRTFSNQARKRVRKDYGPNVGKDGGNPEYRKNVIQLEKERIEREKQELIMKRKRNSNYI